MFGRSLFALMIVGMGFTILTVTLGPISKQVTELRTDGITETGLACTVGALETSCSVAFSSATHLDSILKRWNLFIVVGLMGVMVVGIGLSYNYAKA